MAVGVSTEVRQRVRSAETALELREQAAIKARELIERLETVRLDREITTDGQFDRPKLDRDYEQTLRSAGFEVFQPVAKKAAAQIKASPARATLIAALDDWSVVAVTEERRSALLSLGALE